MCASKPRTAAEGGRPRLSQDVGVPPSLGGSDKLVGDVGEAVAEGPGVKEAQWLLVARLAEEALAFPEHDGEDDQPKLVDEVVFHQRVDELTAGGDDDFAVEFLLQLRDLADHVTVEHRRVGPFGLVECRRDDVLGQAVQPVGPRATPGIPPRTEVLVAPSAQEEGLSAERLGEPELGPRFAILRPELVEPAAVPEAVLAGRVLDHSVERDVLADHDPSHLRSPSVGLSRLATVEASVATETERRISSARDVITRDAGERTSRCEDAGVTEQTFVHARAGDEEAFRALTDP